MLFRGVEKKSRELYAGEAGEFFHLTVKKKIGLGIRREHDWRIDNRREVERKVASGHKVTYVNRGSFRQ